MLLRRRKVTRQTSRLQYRLQRNSHSPLLLPTFGLIHNYLTLRVLCNNKMRAEATFNVFFVRTSISESLVAVISSCGFHR